MINKIINSYNKVEKYTPSVKENYVDKEPIFIDGNTFEAFNKSEFIGYINELRIVNKSDYTGDEAFMCLGAPRLMSKMKAIAITPEARENILLIGRSTEQACIAAITSSAIQSYLAQGKNVQVWAYDKNRLYLTYKNSPWKSEEFSNVRFREGMDSVCDAIYETKQAIRTKKHGDDLIVLIGMDRICSDFEFIESGSSDVAVKSAEDIQKKREDELMKSGATIESVLDQMKRDTVIEWDKMSEEIQRKAKGKTAAQIEKLLKEAKTKLYAEKRAIAEKIKNEPLVTQTIAEQDEQRNDERQTMPDAHGSGEYNALDDFQYIIKQGSRNGYHFMHCLNSYSDLRQTMLKLDMFRHRLAFQVSDEDSRELFGNKNASSLPEHICQYYDTIERYSFRPYLHNGIGWEGWEVDTEGKAIDPSDMDKFNVNANEEK
jgi:hypothetical protein